MAINPGPKKKGRGTRRARKKKSAVSCMSDSMEPTRTCILLTYIHTSQRVQIMFRIFMQNKRDGAARSVWFAYWLAIGAKICVKSHLCTPVPRDSGFNTALNVASLIVYPPAHQPPTVVFFFLVRNLCHGDSEIPNLPTKNVVPPW